jgi:hypothetical protein
VSAAFPELVRVIFCEELLPTLTSPKLTVVGLMLNSGCVGVCACVPVPRNAIAMGEPAASLAIEMLPLAPPTEDGEKLAEKLTLWPALSVVGMDNPAMAKLVPETPAEEIVIPAVPEFVRVIGCDPVLPTATLPKLMLVGVTMSCRRVWFRIFPAGAGTLPELLFADAGTNRSTSDVFGPALIVCGSVSPPRPMVVAIAARTVVSRRKRVISDLWCKAGP